MAGLLAPALRFTGLDELVGSYMHTQTHAHIYIYIYIYVHTQIDTCVHMLCTCVHTYVYIYIHTHIHTCSHTFFCVWLDGPLGLWPCCVVYVG